jgi:WD40 repeat protein/serine/threonine protein kinase/Flp pilus assembly protein TadD
MANCPTLEQLQSFLTGVLSAADEEVICGHVEACVTCQGAMESLVSAGPSTSVPRSADPALVKSALDRLKGATPPVGWSVPRRDLPTRRADKTDETEVIPVPEIPGYIEIEELGRGGMGVVYKARQVALNRIVALKMVFAGGVSGRESWARFRTEVEAVAALHHPNIVQIYEVGAHKGNPFFSMEFAAGGTLRTRFPDKPAPPRDAAELVAKLARAVQYAHDRGIIHRDLKPANVLLTVDGIPKIADFGLAKRIDDEFLVRTQTGRILGTPSYMAPEQASGKGNRAGPAVDTYALGALLYELFTGRPPFDGDSFESTLHQILNEQPVAPRRLNATLPRDLETVCLKCLEKEPHRRYSSAGALADDLERFLSGQPVRVRPVGPLERGLRWCRRNPVLAGAWVGFIGALALGLAGVSWKWHEAETEKKNVENAEQKARRERDEASAARDESKRLTAGMLLDKGIDRAENGAVSEGVFWMLEALKAAPEDDHGLRRAARLNLAAWLPQTHGLRLTIPGDFRCAAISPGGRWIVTGGATGAVQFWDADTGRLHGPPSQVVGDRVAAVAFSPDGARCLVCSPKCVQRFDTTTGKPVGGPLTHPDDVHAAVFSPDGRRIATACEDGVARLWDAADGKPLGELFRDVKTHPICLAFSPDGLTLAIGTARSYEFDPGKTRARAGRSLKTNPAEAHLVDLSTRKRRAGPLRHDGMVNQVAFDRSGTRLLTAGSDGTARLWDATTGRPLGPALVHAGEVPTADFTPDGTVIATSDVLGRVSEVRWWNATTGEPLVGSLPRHRGYLSSLAFSADGRTLITVAARRPDGVAEDDLCVRVWQVARPMVPPPLTRADKINRPSARESQSVSVARVSPDGSTALTWDSEGTVARLWDVETGLPRGKPIRHPWPVCTAAFSPDGVTAAVASYDKPGAAGASVASFCRMIDATSGQVLFTLPHPNWVNTLAFTPDGTLLATGSFDRCVRLWNSATGRRIGATWRQRDIVHRIAFSPDGRSLAVSHYGDDSGSYATAVWKVADRQLRGWELPFDSVFFSPDSQLIASGGTGTTARLWGANTGRAVEPNLTALHPDELHVEFSPEGRKLLMDGTDGSAGLWDVATGRHLGLPMSHTYPVTARAFSPDGQLLLLGYADGTARLWDAVTQKPLGPPIRCADPVRGVAFTHAGRFFVTVGASGPRVIPVPEPLAAEDLDRVRLRLEVRTGLMMTQSGYVTELQSPAWHARRDELARLEGSTESAYPGGVDERIWHEICARNAEADGNSSAAEWHLDRLLALDPTDWRLHARRARVYSNAGQFDRAGAEYSEALRRGRSDELLNWYDHRVAECERAGRWNTALWYVDRAIAAEPKGWERFAVRAGVYDKLGRADERDADVTRAVELGADGLYLLRFGSEYARRGQWVQAIHSYALARERGPTLIVGDEQHALALLRSSNTMGYSELCRKLIAGAEALTDPGSAPGAAWACVLNPGAVDDYGPVVRLASVTVQEVPGVTTRRPGPLIVLGAALYRAGQYREALERLNEAVTLRNGNVPQAWAFLALVHHRLGNATEAKNWFAKIPVQTPGTVSLDWDVLEIEVLRWEVERTMRPWDVLEIEVQRREVETTMRP